GDGAAARAHSRRSNPIPANLDDQPRRHPWPTAIGIRRWPRGTDAATAGHHGHRRIDREHALYSDHHPGWLPGHRKNQGVVQDLRAAGPARNASPGRASFANFLVGEYKMSRVSSKKLCVLGALLIASFLCRGGLGWGARAQADPPSLELVDT